MTPIAARYRRLAHRFTDVIDGVPAERWNDPSPCDGWSAMDVARHVVTTEADFLTRMGFETPAVAQPDDATAVLAAWPAVRDAVQARLDDPASADHEYDGWFGRTTFAATIDTFYSFDLAVHAWDLARAAELDAFLEIPADELVAIRRAVEGMGEGARMPGVLGPALPVADDADVQTRLLADLGRRA